MSLFKKILIVIFIYAVCISNLIFFVVPKFIYYIISGLFITIILFLLIQERVNSRFDFILGQSSDIYSENLINNSIESENDVIDINPDDILSLNISDISSSKLDQKCCICFENFTQNSKISYISECRFHLVHTQCKINYLKHKFIYCPICSK